jgi:hypothetical protein
LIPIFKGNPALPAPRPENGGGQRVILAPCGGGATFFTRPPPYGFTRPPPYGFTRPPPYGFTRLPGSGQDEAVALAPPRK